MKIRLTVGKGPFQGMEGRVMDVLSVTQSDATGRRIFWVAPFGPSLAVYEDECVIVEGAWSDGQESTGGADQPVPGNDC